MKPRVLYSFIHSHVPRWLCIGLACTSTVWAEPIWHCSRSDMHVADASSQFTLAALGEREVIRLTLPDLYAVYHGSPVKVSGTPLSACFMVDKNKTALNALQSIGTNEQAAKALARKNNITNNNLHVVNDESSMLTCITRNHPAIGYLPKAIHTEAVGPCF